MRATPTPTNCLKEIGDEAGPAPLRRLTRIEYNNTVADLLGDTTKPANSFQHDMTIGPFDSNALSPASAIVVQQYAQAAETLAKNANLATLLPCTNPAAAAEQDCARQFIDRFGRRAYRRPLLAEESAGLLNVYTASRTTHGFAFPDSVRFVIEAVLQSPNFVNHIEKGVTPAGGATPKVIPLTSHEIASRLSYLIWQSMPDDKLFEAADAGRLSTIAGITDEVRRMLGASPGYSPRARAGILSFYKQWLDLAKVEDLMKSKTRFPAYTDTLKSHIRGETETFVDHVLWDADGRLATLLTASFSFVNAPLAKIYGVTGPGGDALQKVDLDPTQRAGVLSQASVLAVAAHPTQTSPVLRGKFVRNRLLCEEMPSPPATDEKGMPIDFSPPEPKPGETMRQISLARADDAFCGTCHTLMDRIGVAMEKYDGLGAYRTMDDQGKPIDVTGQMRSSSDPARSDLTFDGLPDLASKLAANDHVRGCVAGSWMNYSMGGLDAGDAQCSVQKLRDDFNKSDGNLRDLIVSVTTSQAFRHRRPITAEVCP